MCALQIRGESSLCCAEPINLKKRGRVSHIGVVAQYAVKCHVKAMEYLKRAKYPDDHQVVIKVADALAHSHHALSVGLLHCY